MSDFGLKEISPNIGAKKGGIIPSGTDLVEVPFFLFLRVVRAKDLLASYGHNSWSPYVEVKLGRFKGRTFCFNGHYDPEWNQVFALEKDQLGTKETTIEIFVKDSAFARHELDDYIGKVSIAISDIPTRFPTDSALAPHIMGLKDHKEQTCMGEIMVSTWIGTQVDEAFPEALHLQLIEASIGAYNVSNICSRVYLMPRIWCLRVHLVQAQDLVLEDKESSLIFIQVTLGNVSITSKTVKSNHGKPTWNEDLLISVAEPFDQQLIFSVLEQGTTQGSHHKLGTCEFPVKNADRRLDGSPVSTKTIGVNLRGDSAGKLLVKLSLDGGYHVFDEKPQFSSNWNPTAKKLWMPSVGVFEMGILSATGLPAMKPGSRRTDAYCVAKYGPKWVRTRTVVNSLSPKWNEQYSWDVFDPSTFMTVSVFDNCQLLEEDITSGAMDTRIGRVRICLSELETNRVYSYSYSLAELQPSGLKRMGEIQLIFRFLCPNMLNLYKVYTLPHLPVLHSTNPLSPSQLNGLRKQTVLVVALKMSKAEPPLRREVVEYVLDSREIAWSMRRGRVDFERVHILVSRVATIYAKFDDICKWKDPIATIAVCFTLLIVYFIPQILLFIMFLSMIRIILPWKIRWETSIFFGIASVLPGLLVPFMFLMMILLIFFVLWFGKPRPLSAVDLQLSHVDKANVDELEEEFDPIPSNFGDNIMRNRYDRLRIAAGKYVALMGELATKGERLQSLLSWQDYTTSFITMILCLIMGIVSFIVPLKFILPVWFLYLVRHPIVRSPFSSSQENWLRRMPSKLDSMI